MSSPATLDPDVISRRRVPPLGGFSATFLYFELRRLLRNRRTVIFTLAMPAVFFLLFQSRTKLQRAGGANFDSITLVGLSVYGAMIAATSGGALVSVERALGWSRQLRLTPLRPSAYIAIKLISAMVLGLMSVGVVNIVAAVEGVRIAPDKWVEAAVLAWAASLVFAAFGLFMGYLFPTENVMQFIAPVLAVFALFGGLFIPVSLLPGTIQDVAPYMPPYGVAQIARFPLLGGTFDFTWLVSMVGWTAAFAAGAAVLFARDTRRV